MDTKKVVPGAILILIAVAILAAGGVMDGITELELAVAAIAMAAGTLLVGTSSTDKARNV